MSGYWQFMPVDNCGIIFADKNEFILNERQTRRITNASNYSKWHGKTVDINHPDEIKPEITRYSHQTTIFGAKFVLRSEWVVTRHAYILAHRGHFG